MTAGVVAVAPNPSIWYILMLLGIYGVVFEIMSPGGFFPGLLGGLALLAGFVALTRFAVNGLGLGLLLLSLALFFAEIKLPTYGVLTAGGVIAFLAGSLILFGADPGTIPVILAATVVTAVFFGMIARLGRNARHAPPSAGAEALIGKVAEAKSDITIDGGQVFVAGEWWKAAADEPIPAGTPVQVLGVKGLTLWVARLTTASSGRKI